ncbi:unnamed protein product, partial [Mesorhabditis spiculigera]
MIAQKEFNSAGRLIFLETIRIARIMRPYAKWGFYGFPYCNYDAGHNGEFTCADNFQAHNDDLAFIMKAGNALFPSLYLGDNRAHRNFRYIQAILAESRRIALTADHPLDIYPYSKFEYDPYDEMRIEEFYEKRDLCNSIKQSADAGTAGIILWSTSKRMWKPRCSMIGDFVERTLGPTVSLIAHRARKCSRKLCNNRGRCVLEGPSDRCVFRMIPSMYRCECDPQYTGEFCEKHVRFPWFAIDNSIYGHEDEVFDDEPLTNTFFK